MKKINISLFLAVVLCITVSCKKNVPEIDKLPAATQTGAETFGCLINGQAFLPHYPGLLGSDLSATFDYTGLFVDATNKHDNGDIYDVSIQVNSGTITTGQIFSLKNNSAGVGMGNYNIFGSLQSYPFYSTTTIVNGEVQFTRIDKINKIFSGTFYFNATDGKGDTVHVTDGRFDLTYPQ